MDPVLLPPLLSHPIYQGLPLSRGLCYETTVTPYWPGHVWGMLRNLSHLDSYKMVYKQMANYHLNIWLRLRYYLGYFIVDFKLMHSLQGVPLGLEKNRFQYTCHMYYSTTPIVPGPHSSMCYSGTPVVHLAVPSVHWSVLVRIANFKQI